MSKFTKILFTSIILFVFTIGYSTTTNAESAKQKDLRLITELKQKIENLGETPIKKSPIKHNLRKKYIAALEEQLEKLEKEKGIKEKKQALMDDLINQIKSLDPDAKPVIDESAGDLSKDEDIIALKKQLEDIRKGNKKKKKAKVAKEKGKAKRVAAITRIKKEIYFLGETPISEFEAESEESYIEALKKQIEELKIIKEAEEKKVAESIPEWFVNIPKGSDAFMYGRGSFKSNNLDYSLKKATSRAKLDIANKIETRLSTKSKSIIDGSGIGENIVIKTKINDITTNVVKEIVLSGFSELETKIVQLEDDWYKAYILLEYPVGQALKAYKKGIDNSPELKGRLTLIKNTDAYKELEKAVAQYSGS